MRHQQRGRLVGLSRWESFEAFQAAYPTVMSFSDERRDEWTMKRDEVLFLTEP